MKEEDAKENGIGRKLSYEEYEIEFHLKVLMELLQKEEEDLRCGFLVKRKMKCHKLHMRREKLMNS